MCFYFLNVRLTVWSHLRLKWREINLSHFLCIKNIYYISTQAQFDHFFETRTLKCPSCTACCSLYFWIRKIVIISIWSYSLTSACSSVQRTTLKSSYGWLIGQFTIISYQDLMACLEIWSLKTVVFPWLLLWGLLYRSWVKYDDSVEWLGMKCCTDVQGPRRMTPDDFCDPCFFI